MRICVEKATNRIIEMHSAAVEGTLIQNALNAGYTIDQIEEREVTPLEYAEARMLDPVYIARQQSLQEQKLAEEQKLQNIVSNLPSWQEVSDAIDGVSTIAGLKVVVKKLARVVYWMAKNTET